MKELRQMTLVALVAVLALVAFPAIGFALEIDAPVVTCTVDEWDGELDISWNDLTGQGADKYAIEIICVHDSTVDGVVEFGTGDCGAFGLPDPCSKTATSVSVPIADLLAAGALDGDTCTVMVRALHEKSGKGQDDLGPNSVNQHPWGTNDDCVLPND
jgi:hypothetical protein